MGLVASALSIGSGGARAQGKAPQRILVLGDSLSAEYGLERGTGWVALLQKRLQERHIEATLVNASISGDTTSGGLARLPPLLTAHKPTLLIVELGANDALRGLPLASMRSNLEAIIKAGRAASAKVLLIGMQVPPNYGRKYSDDFSASFATVAKEQQVPLVPFFLKGVADAPDAEELFQADRLHPLAKAHPTILENVWPVLAPMLK